jgi:hypothetical protein
MTTVRLAFVAIFFFVLALVATAARGDDALPGKPYVVCADFPSSAPAAVVVDIQTVGGSQLANNVTATRGSLDSANASYWCVDLDTVSGFAATCDLTAYAVRFVPDAANCAAGSSPHLCATLTVKSGGPACWGYGTEPNVVYTTSAIPARGITQSVINRGNPSYIRHEIKLDNGGAAVFTYYQVFYYDASGRVERTVRSLTPPSP